MMTEEEKEAINKVLKEQIAIYEKYYAGSEEILPNTSEDYKMSKTLLNYIEKLQKENKKLKNINNRLRYIRNTNNNIIENIYLIDKTIMPIEKNKFIIEMENGNFIDVNEIYINYINKDKIRNKIKELELEGTQQYWTEEVISILENILKENK